MSDVRQKSYDIGCKVFDYLYEQYKRKCSVELCGVDSGFESGEPLDMDTDFKLIFESLSKGVVPNQLLTLLVTDFARQYAKTIYDHLKQSNPHDSNLTDAEQEIVRYITVNNSLERDEDIAIEELSRMFHYDFYVESELGIKNSFLDKAKELNIFKG